MRPRQNESEKRARRQRRLHHEKSAIPRRALASKARFSDIFGAVGTQKRMPHREKQRRRADFHHAAPRLGPRIVAREGIFHAAPFRKRDAPQPKGKPAGQRFALTSIMLLNRFPFALLALSLSSGAAFAQNPVAPRPAAPPSTAPRPAAPPTTPSSALAAQILSSERTQNADALLLAYGQAVTDSNLARAAIAQLLANYYQLRNQAQSAEQATQAVAEASLRFQVLQAAQNQVVIQQNQQLLQQNALIIGLLRKREQGTAAKR